MEIEERNWVCLNNLFSIIYEPIFFTTLFINKHVLLKKQPSFIYHIFVLSFLNYYKLKGI